MRTLTIDVKTGKETYEEKVLTLPPFIPLPKSLSEVLIQKGIITADDLK